MNFLAVVQNFENLSVLEYHVSILSIYILVVLYTLIDPDKEAIATRQLSFSFTFLFLICILQHI